MKNNNQPKQNYSVSFCAWILIIIMFASVLSSCTAVFQPSYPTENAAELTPLVAATMPTIEVPNGTLSLEATATNTPDPLEIAEKQERNKEEIVENIKEFLSSQGKFTFEEIEKISRYFYEESEFKNGNLPLGMITEWHGQFLLLGQIYEENNRQVRMFLGAINTENDRAVFEFNFKRHFEDENMLYSIEVPLYQTKSSPASSISLENQDNMKLIYTEKEWNDFIEEAMLKPVTLFWHLESQEKAWADRGHPGYYKAIDYDLALNFRIAIFNRVPKFGDALRSLRIPPSIDSTTEAENLSCFWNEASFKGMDSLNSTCPTANQIVDIAIRRP